MWQVNHLEKITAPADPDPYFKKAYEFIQLWKSGAEKLILHTSGSTGTPKPIELYRSQMLASARMTGSALNIGEGTRALVCLNIDFIAGTMMLVRGLELGWDLTIVKPSSNPLMDVPPQTKFDFTALAPMQIVNCLRDPDTAYNATRFGKILLGGAPVSTALQNEIYLQKLEVYQSYGMTETVSHVAIRQLSPILEEDYTILGKTVLGTDERGCLNVTGPVTNYEKIQTNDIIEMTSPVTFKWIGRADNVINSGGVKIVLDKIDDILSGIFFDMNVLNLFFSWYDTDELLGQKLVLFVEGSEDSTLVDRIRKEIRTRVKAYETPKHVYFVQKFEKTATDKIDKKRTADINLNRSYEQGN